ncbi:hypothetical protein RXV95_03260 [Novosphingobium sp. ZN18A2]|uniref:hypothetical protein n=1 Tax=Novosphingobium sp. ZN18A2 TaxID=3079861 RepID=UPI0030CC6733
MIRAAWIAMLAAIAVVVTGFELDRQARFDDAFVRFVPAPFRTFALQRKVLAEVREDDADAALADAISLVRRRPMPAQGLTLLAMARARQGEGAVARDTVLLAGTRGWRSLGAQVAVFGMALDAGDHDAAASRLAALWVLDPDRARPVSLTAQLIASPEGRMAFAQVLARGKRWPDGAIRALHGHVPPGELADLVGQAIAAGALFDCGALAASGYDAAGQRPVKCASD